MMIEVILEPANTLDVNVCSLLFPVNVTSVKELQLLNANIPIVSTLSGTITEVIVPQL